MLMGEFKQEILRINNKVNMEIFGQGLLSQRIDIVRNEILITAKNRRVSTLSIVSKVDLGTTDIMDRALVKKFKQRFIEVAKEELGIEVLTHLKDYDPNFEISISVSIFNQPLDELVPTLQLRPVDSSL